MFRTAIEAGVNYFDTAYAYHDWQSEIALGKALQDGFRERVRVALINLDAVYFPHHPQQHQRYQHQHH